MGARNDDAGVRIDRSVNDGVVTCTGAEGAGRRGSGCGNLLGSGEAPTIATSATRVPIVDLIVSMMTDQVVGQKNT